MKSSQEFILESKKIKPEDLRKTVEIHFDTVYNDGYDSPAKARKALKELIDKSDCEMLDYLVSAIDAHDGKITEDDLLDNWDEFVKIAQEIAKNWDE